MQFVEIPRKSNELQIQYTFNKSYLVQPCLRRIQNIIRGKTYKLHIELNGNLKCMFLAIFLFDFLVVIFLLFCYFCIHFIYISYMYTYSLYCVNEAKQKRKAALNLHRHSQLARGKKETRNETAKNRRKLYCVLRNIFPYESSPARTSRLPLRFHKTFFLWETEDSCIEATYRRRTVIIITTNVNEPEMFSTF